MSKRKDDDAYDVAMGRDPLADDDEVLARTIFGGERIPQSAPVAPPAANTARRVRASSTRRTKSRRKSRNDHYKVISISMYNEDIAQMDKLVEELKKRGFTRANRSALIRFALDNVDIDKMPRGY